MKKKEWSLKTPLADETREWDGHCQQMTETQTQEQMTETQGFGY